MAKTVVLDVDGTLMDTTYLHTQAWARAFEDVGHRLPTVDLHRQIGKDSRLLIRDFIDDGEVEKIQELHAKYYSELQRFGHPLPGAKELIAKLREVGHPVWFVTSAKNEELGYHMEELDVQGRISGVVNSDAVDRGKPYPDIFEEALKRMETGAEDTVAVGDTVWDVQSAEGAGIPTVAVLTGGAFSPQELEKAGAAEVHKDCAALLESGFPG